MNKAFLKRKEVVILCAAVLLCVASLAIFSLFPKGNVAVVSVDGAAVARIDLARNKIYRIDAVLPVTLEVMDGKLRFVDSHCPDKLCEGFGWIGDEYDYAICMPAHVAVVIEA
ncbi:MAG: NusG domain II-containing protein, partial [Oscillospiraceae bacterium]